MTLQAAAQGTVFDALVASLQKVADHNRDDTVAPAAVLWPDEKREWERIISRLRVSLPHFLVLGNHDKANRTGPGIWLRCVLGGKVGDITWPANSVPIIYLPGVSRATLRATDECPTELKPLAELQYRGVFWSQHNGKDWTIAAFLQTNHGGLQLAFSKDQDTAKSIRRAIENLIDVPVAELRAKSTSGDLNGKYFDLLISDDPIDDLLAWLSDPEGSRSRWDDNRWETLCGDCVKNYSFDPVRDGPFVGAEMLGLQEKPAWKTAWKRFASSPTRYPGLIHQLRRAKPLPKKVSLFENQHQESWPQDNEAAEDELRRSLVDLSSQPLDDARKALLELEKNHKPRRDWVWAKFNLSPLANALEHLSKLAELTEARLAAATMTDMVKLYTEGGWKADAAVLDALASVSNPNHSEAVGLAIAHIYTPWLRDSGELFQQRAKQEPLPGRNVPRLPEIHPGTCTLFVDGLRYDVGQKLKIALEAKLGPLQIRHQFVALPSVTPTAKPAVSPVAGKIKGTTAGEEFRPCVAVDEKDLTPDRFRKLLDDAGIQFLGAGDLGEPTGRAWTEIGNVDKTGHAEGAGLARRIPELIVGIVHRIESLVAAGWREVRIVTDHGWLLLPKGLPKADLPKYLTETRWGRCAVVKSTATVELPWFSWFWADDVRVACPNGIDCFIAGKEYNHGGLSLQECVVPQFSIQVEPKSMVSARIESFKWAGLRCRIKIEGQFNGCKIDLRDKAADATSSLAEAAKDVGTDGTVSLVVKPKFDTREGTASFLVLIDPQGNVLEKTPVTVGG
jgi:hypothetical protein